MWSVEVWADPAAWQEVGAWWNLCHGPRFYPFLTHQWFRLWHDAFLPEGARLELVAFMKEGNVCAVLPLYRRGLRRASLSNAHTEVFDLVSEEDPDVGHVALNWLKNKPFTRLFSLDGQSAMIPKSPTPSWRVDRTLEALYLDLSGDTETLWSRLSGGLRTNLARKARKLGQLGEVNYIPNAEAELPNALEQCFELEARGWKGREGTAILSRPATTRFYRQMTAVARDAGWLHIDGLLVADRLVAFELSLDYGGRRFWLKSGYDETLGNSHSPGLVLKWHALQQAQRTGLISYELGGEAETWKRQWASSGRSRLNALVLGGTGPGRLLGWAGRARAMSRRIRPSTTVTN